ncbi:ubiquinone anaerobic biosynthesis protein UbiU [Polymorphobacter fuscus]|uniref:U32 family peptidase n=1 Tax=Sandarakinorhabdus fusca TaxID=1439888 RepID=A0A7C9GRQ8_9SPHN|nr:peptidase U32 family protein [Polymorphobacter fuscus]KAB7643725.1 U32 family peptidase [Polymorphobacter fuscus]MQT18670.1 U32 family peptidase [Polymorphobacter fuscus]NJC08113.1 collagenase-like PrtC family protease [Polymorphobacter fuscus]
MIIPEIVAPAGTPAALVAAIDAGADTVYCGFRDATNARNYPGLNFTPDDLVEGLAYAHARGRKVNIAINTYASAGNTALWHKAIDTAADLGADAVIMADIGLIDYAARRHPKLRRHLSVQGGASTISSIQFYYEAFGIARMILPRMFTVAEIAELKSRAPIEIECFIFGSMSPMTEGRCAMSAYATGRSPNLSGVCSPAECVRYDVEDDELLCRLGDFVMNSFGPDEQAGYPTVCKGRYIVGDAEPSYAFEEPECLNAAEYIGAMRAAGICAFKIEGRQRGRFYVSEVVSAFRELIDAEARGEPAARHAGALQRLRRLAEGGEETRGAFKKGWQ